MKNRSDGSSIDWLEEYAELYSVTLRDTEHIVKNLVLARSIIDFGAAKALLIPFLATLKVKDITAFNALKEGRYSYEEAVRRLKLENLNGMNCPPVVGHSD